MQDIFCRDKIRNDEVLKKAEEKQRLQYTSCCRERDHELNIYLAEQQPLQLSQRDRATLRVIEYFAKSLKITQGYSK